MDYITGLFYSPRFSESQQVYFDKLAPHVKVALQTKPFKDQELLVLTLSKQSEERAELLYQILEKQSEEAITRLFKKETRLLNALLKIDTCYLVSNVDEPDYITSMIMKESESI